MILVGLEPNYLWKVKMKKVVTLLFVLCICFLIFSSLFRLFQGFKTYQTEKEESVYEKKNSLLHKETYWIKNDFIVVFGYWKIPSGKNFLEINQKYYLIQKINEEEQCFIGKFFLKKKSDKSLIFSGDRENKNSKLNLYAKINNQNYYIHIIPDFLYTQEKIQNCKEWIKIENK
jgi:hypothetical protein